MNATAAERHKVARNPRLVNSASSASDVDRLHETCHDMRQPVASILALADAALCDTAIPSSVRSHLGQVRDQAEWLGDLLQQLVDPHGAAEGESHDLIHLASNAVQTEMVTYPGDIVVQWSGDNMCVLGNWIELRRAIANLLSNATRAAGTDGRVVVELRRVADRVLLTVDDSGPGYGLIRQGVGLGLRAVARGLASYGGRIEYSRSQLGGVRAILSLRAVDH
jgi:signal transduction histidine kinase